jgi:carbamoylphosphate synthase large subunit
MKDQKTVLIQGAGGGGGNNLIRSLRRSGLRLRILGSNCHRHVVLKSSADQTFLLPHCTENNYIETLNKLISNEKIDLIIPNNDSEVATVSRFRDQIYAQVFLPDNAVVELCQDKQRFYQFLELAGQRVVESANVKDLEGVDDLMAALPPSEKYWVRPRKGSGSKGATWVRTPDQARNWMTLWNELRGFEIEDFQISVFLPGRDYNVQTIWKEGELVAAKMAERLSYYMGANRLSGMSSSPERARTLCDPAALDVVTKIIKALPGVPHGSYNVDMKGDHDQRMFVNEINIGRFPMITTIHDSVGPVNTAAAYIQSAFGESFRPFSFDDMIPDYHLIRELDTEPLIVTEAELDKLIVYG